MISEAARIPSLESPVYANTEGLWGLECERHEGIHLFEDAALLENVNEDGCPVPPGEPGARLLITSLYNMVQPVIRLEVTMSSRSNPGPARAVARSFGRAPSKAGATMCSSFLVGTAARWRSTLCSSPS
jgi:phenylacetate-CoA ligase